MENNIIVNRELIIKPLQYVTNIISNKSLYPNLNNILIEVLDNGIVLFKSTNLEIEITSFIKSKYLNKNYSVIIQGKKFYNICRSLSKEDNIKIVFNINKMIISTKNCYFIITTLPANNFPNINFLKHDIEFNLTNKILKKLIYATYFSIANNDVRKYLNGLFLQIKNNILNIISTDGHRLSFYQYILDKNLIDYSIIIPRKSIFELSKIINNTNDLINIKINNNYICFTFKNLKFISKLIVSNFPDYQQIIPKSFYQTIKINRILFKNVLNRISILVNEKTKGVNLLFSNKYLKIFTSNINNEKAEEILEIEKFRNKQTHDIQISFNINYLIDVINILESNFIKLSFIDNTSSIKIEDNYDKNKIYLIMPMKI
ncbi:DNA polymerase III subunit beta [Enterobacteriaceae endosymbiont of Donacia cincticornis]|uniref:DNA polymerase III subunit beta n=1 Tax=Enterobacteriaceae endosymbiont of Donacia cincticornis TaxID=2675773 RepID=UPI001448F406|nr:DNA polymerase III subunit beta [Enterobacteriaceae endosymbiont of Donacia cincticornis]QJC36289.1 DNA polymerase III subunit beta [Enterobacteriaceae endosymbiont of Donacia cincticornis]